MNFQSAPASQNPNPIPELEKRLADLKIVSIQIVEPGTATDGEIFSGLDYYEISKKIFDIPSTRTPIGTVVRFIFEARHDGGTSCWERVCPFADRLSLHMRFCAVDWNFMFTTADGVNYRRGGKRWADTFSKFWGELIAPRFRDPKVEERLARMKTVVGLRHDPSSIFFGVPRDVVESCIVPRV